MNITANEYYVGRLAELKVELETTTKRGSQLYFLRLILFLLLVGCFLLLLSGDHLVVYGLAVATLFTLFISVVIRDLKLKAKREELQLAINFYEGECAALCHDFHSREDGAQFAQFDPHLSGDFDLFGHGSLYQYLNRSVTLAGRSRFAARLVGCELSGKQIAARAKAIRELSTKRKLIEQFIVAGAQIKERGDEVANLLKWIEQPIPKESLISVLRVILPTLNGALLIAIAAGLSPLSLLSLTMLLSLVTVYINYNKVNRAHQLLGRSAKIFESYSALIKLIESEKFTSQLLCNEQNKLKSEGKPVSQSIAELKALLNRFDYRYNIYVSFFLNAFLLFDLQSYEALLRWKRLHKGQLSHYFDAISEIDSLIGLAQYAYNCSDISCAATVVQESDFRLAAEDLKHPLIARERAVGNSIEINNRPSVVIITGANMAGKSTFLRTLAVNMILAMNGAPVVAKSFCFTPVKIFSSIKIQDSLLNRESYFYAELSRLSHILERCDKQPQTMIILDEILRGTNTMDKQQGSMGLLRKIVANEGVAIIATHDLVIGKLEEEYPTAVQNYCFEVEIEGERLSFDYKLKSGISSKLNASLLMRQMGII